MNRVLLFFALLACTGGVMAQEAAEKTAVDYNNAAVEAYRNKNYKAAYESFEKAIELFTAQGEEVSGDLYYNTGYCAFKSKKYDESLPLFEKAIEADYKTDKAYIYVSQVYMKKNDLAKMEEVTLKSLATYPEDKTLNKLAAICYQKQGLVFYNKGNKIKKAANDSGMNETDPDAFLLEYEKANTEFEKALPLFEKSYQYNAKSESTLKALKNTYTSLKMEDKAAKIAGELEAM